MSRIAGCLFGVCLAMGTISAAGPEFEVASIRPSPPITLESVQSGRARQGMTVNAGRIDYAGIPMPTLLSLAFGVSPNQINGPDWMREQRFDIQAKMPAGASEDQVPQMLQALLEERFKLTVHRERKDQSGYALVVAKGGLKVKEAEADADTPAPAAKADPDAPPPPPSMVVPLGGAQTRITEDPNGRGATVTNALLGTVRASEGPTGMRLEAPSTTFEGLANLLAELLRQPVTDMTGLKGRYQVFLEMSQDEMVNQARARGGQEGGGPGAATPTASDPTGSPFFAAVQKLGLKLESRKLPVETIVVDHLEKTPTEN